MSSGICTRLKSSVQTRWMMKHILSTSSGIDTCKLRHRQDGSSKHHKDDEDAVYQGNSAAQRDCKRESGTETNPTVANIPSDAYDVDSSDMSLCLLLKSKVF
jgi:hypothetical protein